MKCRRNIVQFNANPRTRTFINFRAQRTKETFYVRPRDIRRCRTGEEPFKPSYAVSYSPAHGTTMRYHMQIVSRLHYRIPSRTKAQSQVSGNSAILIYRETVRHSPLRTQ